MKLAISSQASKLCLDEGLTTILKRSTLKWVEKGESL
jgi:hypothetical protein